LSARPIWARAVAVGLGDGLGHGAGARRERGPLEHAHRPVPEHGAGAADLVGEGAGGLGADVQPHPALLDLVDAHGPVLGVGLERVGHDHVGRQQDPNALVLGPGQQTLDGVELVLLDQGVADLLALGGQQREAHAAADHERVAPAEQVAEHGELVGDL
jgi:hypothetical protein